MQQSGWDTSYVSSVEKDSRTLCKFCVSSVERAMGHYVSSVEKSSGTLCIGVEKSSVLKITAALPMALSIWMFMIFLSSNPV